MEIKSRKCVQCGEMVQEPNLKAHEMNHELEKKKQASQGK
ncbi:MAG: hypothetical protein QT03_C0001G1040 [archaeon GW2011_AR10]|nr:MAG: hypothetical protein QT03_C0001G1040 [archaeon GW2011_AR10]